MNSSENPYQPPRLTDRLKNARTQSAALGIATVVDSSFLYRRIEFVTMPTLTFEYSAVRFCQRIRMNGETVWFAWTWFWFYRSLEFDYRDNQGEVSRWKINVDIDLRVRFRGLSIWRNGELVFAESYDCAKTDVIA